MLDKLSKSVNSSSSEGDLSSISHKNITRIETSNSVTPYGELSEDKSTQLLGKNKNNIKQFVPTGYRKSKSRFHQHSQKELSGCKRKSVIESIEELNNKLWARFKFSYNDLEEIERSKVLQFGKWNRDPSSDLLIKIKKEQRRKEYWNRRMNC